MELRSHVGTTARLVRRAEIGTRGVRHLALIGSRLRVSTTTATLVMITTASSRTTSHMVAHVTVRRLRRFASQMSRLRSGTKGGLSIRAHLLLVDEHYY